MIISPEIQNGIFTFENINETPIDKIDKIKQSQLKNIEKRFIIYE